MSTPLANHLVARPITVDVSPKQKLSDTPPLQTNFEQGQPPRGLSKLYHSIGRLLGGIKGQIGDFVPELPNLKQPEQTAHGLKVMGIADRLPQSEGAQNQFGRDLIILGTIEDYAQPVRTITIDGVTSNITIENDQVVARNLEFGGAKAASGYLTLEDGSQLPLDITVITAL